MMAETGTNSVTITVDMEDVTGAESKTTDATVALETGAENKEMATMPKAGAEIKSTSEAVAETTVLLEAVDETKVNLDAVAETKEMDTTPEAVTKDGATIKTVAETENTESTDVDTTPKAAAEANAAVDAGDPAAENAEMDPYGYVKTDLFTSEAFKIEVENLPRRFGFVEVKKRMAHLNLTPVKVKLMPHRRYIYVTFRSEEQVEEALTAINGHVWKGCQLTAKKAKPIADPLLQKRKEREAKNGADEPSNKKQKVESNLDIQTQLKNAVTDLWHLSYDEQLKQKTDDMDKFMRKFASTLIGECPLLHSTVKDKIKQNHGRICALDPIRASPVTDAYRNKCEFTIGYGPEGQVKTVGFRVSKYRDGSCTVCSPDDIITLPDIMKHTVKVFESYLQTSKYSNYDHQKRSGHWKQLTVRTTQTGQIMAFPEFNTGSMAQSEIDEVTNHLVSYFSSGPGKDCNITSLYFVTNVGRDSGRQIEYHHVLGEKAIVEELMGMKFTISPDAFFQVNTVGAAMLYGLVGEWCAVNENSILLDICCGTGTIGLSLAKHVSRVYGIEMCEQAVEDARNNAKLNGIENAEFICGKAENAINDLMRRLPADADVIAVVDPPRAGLDKRVTHALRRCTGLKKFVYLSCRPHGALTNFVDFGRPASKRTPSAPFYPSKAVPCDLFPHTRHCELMILFERLEANDDS